MKHCTKCGGVVYLVRSAEGEVFLVDHYGRRWCPA